MQGLARNSREPKYNNDTLLFFEIEDSSGAIPVVASGEASKNFSDIIKTCEANGSVLKIFKVAPRRNTQSGNLEIKLFSDTRIEVDANATMTVEKIYDTVSKSKASGRPSGRIKCVLCDLDEPTKTRKGEEKIQGMIMDAEEVTMRVLFLGKLVEAASALDVGQVLHIEGRWLSDETFIVSGFEKTTDDTMAEIWSSKERYMRRIDLSRIVDIKSAEPGAKGSFTGVVRSCSVQVPVKDGTRFRRTFTVVDPSMAVVDVAHFYDDIDCGSDDIQTNDCVTFRASVSSFNVRSLTTRAIEVVNHKELAAWWVAHKDAQFEDISIG